MGGKIKEAKKRCKVHQISWQKMQDPQEYGIHGEFYGSTKPTNISCLGVRKKEEETTLRVSKRCKDGGRDTDSGNNSSVVAGYNVQRG